MILPVVCIDDIKERITAANASMEKYTRIASFAAQPYIPTIFADLYMPSI